MKKRFKVETKNIKRMMEVTNIKIITPFSNNTAPEIQAIEYQKGVVGAEILFDIVSTMQFNIKDCSASTRDSIIELFEQIDETIPKNHLFINFSCWVGIDIEAFLNEEMMAAPGKYTLSADNAKYLGGNLDMEGYHFNYENKIKFTNEEVKYELNEVMRQKVKNVFKVGQTNRHFAIEVNIEEEAI